MKHAWFALSIVVALVSVCSCKRKGEASSQGKVYVYSFKDSRVYTLDDSKKMLETFLGAVDTGPLYKSDENTVYFVSRDDVTETFEQDLNNGNFAFNKGVKKYLGEYVPRLPNKEDALRAAKEYLRKNTLLPNDTAQLRMAHYGGIRSNSVIDGKKAGPVVDKMLTLTYGRVVDDTPVIGSGSKIIVQIGEGGEVLGLVRRWRELSVQSKKEVQPEEMISQEEAEEMARRQIQQQYGERAAYKILGSGKAYYDNNGKILQPVYTFETTIDLKDKRVKLFNYLCVIPMLKHSPEPLQLTAVDPKAKELIKNIKRGEPLPSPKDQDDVTD